MGVRGRRVFVNPTFSPGHVPQIAAGEYWLPAVGVSGSSTISWAGRNGTNTMTTAAAQCPDAVTGPGGNPAWSYVAANSDIFTIASPAGPLTATDGVYVGCWFRFDSLDTTNRVIVQQHGSAGARKWELRKTGSNNVLQLEFSQDGTAVQTAASAILENEGVGTQSMLDKYLFVEFVCDTNITSSLGAQTQMWLNMKPVTFSTHTGSILTALSSVGVFRYGNNNFENQDFNGQLGPVYVGKRANGRLLPIDDHRRKLMMYLTPKDRRVEVVCRGNSLTQGTGASGASTTYPAVFKSLFTTAGYVGRDVHDRGRSGATTEEILDNFFTNEFLLLDKTFDRSVNLMFEVRNSSTAQTPAETILNQHIAYWKRSNGAGFWTPGCTAPPSGGAPAGSDTIAGRANQMIRNAAPYYTPKLIDLERIPEFAQAGSAANPTHYDDDVHLNDTGYAVLARKMFSAVIT